MAENVVPEVDNYPIYKMLIQPLVENCVLHAFSERAEGGHIAITFTVQDTQICICITDNGKGISPAKMKQLNELQNNIVDYTEDNIGIYNVLNRLDAYYGKDAHLEICSNESGTTVFLYTPTL